MAMRKTRQTVAVEGDEESRISRRIRGVRIGGKQEVHDEDEDEGWGCEERHKQRFERIRNRKCTGRETINEKLKHLRREALAKLEREDVDIDDDDEEVVHVPRRGSRTTGRKDEKPLKSRPKRRDEEGNSHRGVKIGERKDIADDDEDSQWDAEERHVKRFNRIKGRRPTGHPALGKKLQQLRTECENIAADACSNEGDEDDDNDTSDDVPVVIKPSRRGSTRRKVTNGKVKVEDARVQTIPDGDSDWDNEARKKERFTRISTRHPTGHPAIGKKLQQLRDEVAQLEGEKKSPSNHRGKKSSAKVVLRVADSDDSEEEDDDEDDEDDRKRVGLRRSKVKIGGRKFREDREADEEWDNADRAVERVRRINARRPTGHPALGKKLQKLRQEVEMLQAEESDDEDYDEQPARGSRSALRSPAPRAPASSSPRGGSRSPQKGGEPRSPLKGSPPTRSSKRGDLKARAAMPSDSDSDGAQGRRVKIGRNVVKASCEDDDPDWGTEERRETRFKRIRSRVPTGHPALAKKLAQLRQEVKDFEDDEDDD